MSGSSLEAGWLPDATCELNPVFPGATLEGGGSAHIAQNHQINIPHRVAHRVSHYSSRLVVCRGPYPAFSFLSPSPPPFQSVLVTHVKKYFCDVSFSKPSPRSESWENGVPRIGLRTPPTFLSSFRSRSTI